MKQLLARAIHSLGIRFLMPVFPLSEKEFTELFVRKLQRVTSDVHVHVADDLRIECIYGDQQQGTLFLENAYGHYLKYPRDFDEVLRVYIKSFRETASGNSGVVASRIVPVIKDHAWLEEMRRAMNERHDRNFPEFVFETLNEALVVVYAEDTDSNISYLNVEELVKLEIPATQMRALALPNLRRLLPRPEIHWNESTAMITAGGDYEASLLLLDELWQPLQKDGREIIAAIPARDLLLFTYLDDETGMAQLKEMVARLYSEAGYRLTDALFIYRAGKFEVFSRNN